MSRLPPTVVGAEAARNFGTALVLAGLLILTLGIAAHVRFMLDLRREHDLLVAERLSPTTACRIR